MTRMPLLNRVSFAIYWMPWALACLALLVIYPLIVVWGWIDPRGAIRFTDSVADMAAAQNKRIEASRERLCRSGE